MDFDVKNSKLTKEFSKLILWDKRCNKSLKKISIKIFKKQGTSFSSACGSSLRQNGSRIFSDKRMNTETIQSGHYQETLRRIKKERVILLAQDTTYLNYSGHKSALDLGNIGTVESARGLVMHSALALSETGLSLGILKQHIWARNPEDYGKKHKRNELKIDEKESNKWLTTLEACQEKIQFKGQNVWLISDRESDIYEYIIKKRKPNFHILLRASQKRRIQVINTGEVNTLFKHISTLPVRCTKTVELSRSNRIEAVELSVRYDNVEILRPVKNNTSIESVPVGIVYAKQEDGGTESIEWVLITDKKIETEEDALKYLDYYSQRWKIERFHYILKQGLKIENLQFDDAHTLSNAVSFYSIIAWFTQWLTYIGREAPKLGATKVIDKLSIEILEAKTKKKITNAYEVLIAVGILGGFLGGSKKYPYPGLKSIWTGIMFLEAMKQGWLLAKQMLKNNYAT